MLVLSRLTDESICIGENIRITVVAVRGDKVRIGIDAPTSVPVHRHEVYEAIKRERAAAKPSGPRDLASVDGESMRELPDVGRRPVPDGESASVPASAGE